MGKGAHSRAQQAAIAMSKKNTMRGGGMAKKNGKKKMRVGKKDKGRFPGDVNHDGKISGADFKLARKMGKLR